MAGLQVDGWPEIRAARAYRPRSPWWRFSSSRAAEGRHAQTLQIDHIDTVAVLPGDLVFGVRLEGELSERQIERVEHEEAAPEWLTDAEHQFECLERLKAADDAGEHPDYARLCT